jgi:DNA-binding FrmR family transcriptional regulator
MVDEDRYCIDVLTQISAIQAALDKVALGLLDDHVRHCVKDAGAEGCSEEMATEMMAAVGRLMRRDRWSPSTAILAGGVNSGITARR